MMEATGAPANPVVPYTWPSVAIVNDKSSGVSDADAEKMTEAIAHQVLYDFGPIWHIGAHFTFVGIGGKPPAGQWAIALLDSSDVAGALGYHDLTPDGLPLGKVFAGTDRQFGEDSAVTLSHEVLEMLGDPWIDLSAQDDTSGKFYSWEACDAVEARTYAAPNGVNLSAFITPAWFGHGAGELTFPAGLVARPFQLAPGGYTLVFDPSSGHGWTQQFASKPSSAQELIAALPRVGSRRERRHRGRGYWAVSTYEQQ